MDVDLSRLSQLERRRQEGTLATLPQSFHPSLSGHAVVAIDGSDPNWPSHLQHLCGSDTLGILITPPTPSAAAPVSAALRYAENRQIPIAIDSHWAGHPGWDAFAQRVRADLPTLALADVLITTSPTDAAVAGGMLLEQLRCLDRVLPTDSQLSATYSHTDDGGHEVVADLEGVSVNLVAAPGPTTRITVNLIGAPSRWEIEGHGRHPAARLTATRMDSEGDWGPPDAWGSATRSTWQQLRASLDGENSTITSSTNFIRSLARLETLSDSNQITRDVASHP